MPHRGFSSRAVVITLGMILMSLSCAGQARPPAPAAAASPAPFQSPSPAPIDAAAAAIGPGAPASERLHALQKGIEGRVSRDDRVTLSPPNASMGVLPMMAGEIQPDWVGAVIAANNLGPSAASVSGYISLRDRQGRTFEPLSGAEFPQYDELLRAVQEQRKPILGDRELLGYAVPIQPSKDAFVLLVFHIAPDSEELALAAR